MKNLKNVLVVLMSSVVLLSQAITPVAAASSQSAMIPAYTLVKSSHRATVPNSNGSPIIYTLVFTNNTNEAVSMKFEDVIPAGTQLYHIDGWECSDNDSDGNWTEAGEKCTSQESYNVAANSSVSATFVAVTFNVGTLSVISNQAAAKLPRAVTSKGSLNCGSRYVVCSNIVDVKVVAEASK